MISTDIIQAGMDIPQCSLVLRYDVSQILIEKLIRNTCL